MLSSRRASPFRTLRHALGHVELIFEIVILAMIAAFLGLRLYSVLGRRAEHEEEPVPTRFERSDAANAPRAVTPPVAELPRRNREIAGFAPAIEQGLRDISTADRRFDLLSFLEGAKAAYGMVLEAFWRSSCATTTSTKASPKRSTRARPPAKRSTTG
jgi:predicted lipid-binding transport protein (Tim44 family)